MFAAQVSNLSVADPSSRSNSPFPLLSASLNSATFEDVPQFAGLGNLNPQYIFCSGSSGYSSIGPSPLLKDNSLQQVPNVLNDQSEGQTQLSSQHKDDSAGQLPVLARKMTKPDSYKTVMCKGWLEMGGCSFGENCRFAHGEEELRPTKIPVDNPKYKTKLCDKYTKTGVCPYGDRCLFIHPKAVDSSGVASNPYIHPDRMAQLLRDRTTVLMNSRREINSQDTPLSSRMTARIQSWPFSALKNHRQEKVETTFRDCVTSRTPSPCDIRVTPESTEQKRSFGNTLKFDSTNFESARTILNTSENVNMECGVGFQIDKYENPCWSARISEVFDYAIETDNMARLLAKNLSSSF